MDIDVYQLRNSPVYKSLQLLSAAKVNINSQFTPQLLNFVNTKFNSYELATC